MSCSRFSLTNSPRWERSGGDALRLGRVIVDLLVEGGLEHVSLPARRRHSRGRETGLREADRQTAGRPAARPPRPPERVDGRLHSVVRARTSADGRTQPYSKTNRATLTKCMVRGNRGRR